MPYPLPPKERITRHITVDAVSGCWNWKQCCGADQYGRVGVNYRKMLAHRVAYMDFIGPISEDSEIDHLCFNRACVNPNHLEAVTHSENLRRAGAIGRMDRRSQNTHCKNGHLYDDANTRITPEGWRDCRTCQRLKMRRRRSTK